MRAVDRRIVRLLVASLLFAAALFALRGLLSGRLPGGATELHAAREAARSWADALGAGRLPLWQPSPPPGAPLLATPGAQAFHPLRLVHLVFGPTAGLVVLLVGQLLLLGAGMYALARALGRSRGASLLAALGAQLSPLVAAAAGHPALFASLCLAPWPVSFAVRTTRGLRLHHAALTGALTAAVLLAGSVEVAFGAALAAGFALLGGLGRGGPRLGALALVAGAICLLLPAVAWLPFLEAAFADGVLAPTIRGATPGIAELFRVVLPFTGVEPPRLPTAVDRWEAEHLLRSIYLGGPIVLLAFARPTAGGERRIVTTAFVLAGIALAPLAASLTARFLPGLGVADPVTFAAPALLGFPLLAAFGADGLAGERRSAVIRRPLTGPRLALEGTVALLGAVAIALTLFATDAGILLSASVAWILGGAVVLVLLVRGLGVLQTWTLPAVLAVLVAVDLGGVHLLDPPLERPVPAPADDGVSGHAPPAPPRPRVVVAARHQVLSRDTALARASASDFDPRQAVLLDEPPATVVLGGAGTALVTRDDPEELHVLADAPGGGWLLVTDRWAPGWKAWVDGTPAPVVRANGNARAVALPRGLHQVDLRYEPASWVAGLAVTAAGAALFVFSVVLGRRRAQRRSELGWRL